MSWTDDRVSLLKQLWGEGKTAAEIAAQLGGVTRNAVIGKAHRLKLSSRVSPIQQNKKPVKTVAKAKSEKQPPKKQLVADCAEFDATIDKVKMVDLDHDSCRWPIGDPRDADFGFCGCKKLPGLPYCMTHAKVAYQAATRNKILQAEKERTEVAEANAVLKKAANS